MTRTSSRSNEPVTPADRCPFAERRDFTQCPAHHVVSVKPKGAASRSLEPELSCTFLIAGHLANGRPYPRCAIGSASARELVVERRRNELNEIVAAALMPDSSDDHGEVGVMVADDEARYVAVNQSMCRMLGYESDDQLLGKSVWDLTPGPHYANGRAIWRDFVAVGESFGTYRLICSDGRLKTFDFTARANVIPGVHVSILRPADRKPRSRGNELPAASRPN